MKGRFLRSDSLQRSMNMNMRSFTPLTSRNMQSHARSTGNTVGMCIWQSSPKYQGHLQSSFHGNTSVRYFGAHVGGRNSTHSFEHTARNRYSYGLIMKIPRISTSTSTSISTMKIPSTQNAYMRSSIRNFAVRVNFGQGGSLVDTHGISDAKNPKNFERTDAQRKLADLQLEQIENSTNRILRMDTTKSGIVQKKEVVSLCNEVQVALHYWSYNWITHHHPFVSIFPTHVKGLRYDQQSQSSSASASSSASSRNEKSDEHCYGDYGPKQAERLLNWILQMDKSHPEHKFIQKILGKSGGNAAFTNIVDAYLIPCTRSTHDSSTTDDFIQFSTKTGSHNINPSMWSAAIYDACRILDVMEEVMATELEGDVNTDNAVLQTWAKLSTLLDLKSITPSSAYQSENTDANKNANSDSDISIPSSWKMTKAEEVIEALEGKLKDMEQKYFATRKKSIKPNQDSYRHVFRSIATSGNATGRLQWYIERMERTEDLALGGTSGEDEEAFPLTTAFTDEEIYNIAINAYASGIDQRLDPKKKLEIAEKADSILKNMEHRYERIKREGLQPSTITYSTILKAWVNAGRAEEAENILKKMITLSENSSIDVRPNLICFNTVIGGWAKAEGDDSAIRALNLLEQMEELSETESYSHVYPDTITYSSVIAAFSRSYRKDAGDRAEDLLQRSLRLFQEGNRDLKPDTVTFNSVLDALVKQKQQCDKSNDPSIDDSKDLLLRAEKVMERMKKMNKDGDTSVRPGTISYNILLKMYTLFYDKNKVEELFLEMCQKYEDGHLHMKPDTISYNSYLFALASSPLKSDTEKAVDMLNKMENHSHDPSSTMVKANVTSYLSIIRALAKQSRQEPRAAATCNSILKSMESKIMTGESSVIPTVICYNCCIDAYAKSGNRNSAQIAVDLIDRMDKLSRDLNIPDLQPNIISFASALNAIANSNQRSGPESAETLLDRMMKRDIKPNTWIFNSIINCWARSRRSDAGERAEEILEKMRKLSEIGNFDANPNRYTFVSIMNCWASSKDKHAAERAEFIFNQIENGNTQLVRTSSLRDNRYTYGALLNMWAKSSHPEAPDRALKLLHTIEERYEMGDGSAKPNTYLYNAVLNAIAKGKSENKAEEAEDLLKRMMQHYELGNDDVQPNVMTYGVILNACSYTFTDSASVKLKAFKIARNIFKIILTECEPNHIIFSSFIQACFRLMPPGEKRDQFVQSIFEECCQHGEVSMKAILSVRGALPQSKLETLLQGTSLARGRIDFQDIPSDWRKNVKERR